MEVWAGEGICMRKKKWVEEFFDLGGGVMSSSVELGDWDEEG